jgi:hypothetical protein
LAWGGTAMAQTNFEALDKAAEECDDDVTYEGPVALFPYFADESTGFVGGFAVINTDEETTIPANELCFVGVDADGDVLAKKHASAIYPSNMATMAVSGLGTGWDAQLYMGLYAKNKEAAVLQKVEGFGMIGDGTQGQGYFAVETIDNDGDVQAADEQLLFNYFPGDGWARGLAVVNTTNTDVVVEFVAYEEGGNQETVTAELDAGAMLSTTADTLFVDDDGEALLNPNTRVRIVATAYEDDDLTAGEEVAALYGFAMFGDGSMAQGYLAPGQVAP